jgi:hypothetical protein
MEMAGKGIEVSGEEEMEERRWRKGDGGKEMEERRKE